MGNEWAHVSDGANEAGEKNTTSGISGMDAPAVAEYLKKHPQFFEDYAVPAEVRARLGTKRRK